MSCGGITLGLVHRANFHSSLNMELKKKLSSLSKQTRLQLSTLLDEAIEDLLKKYKFKDEEEEKDG